MININEIEIMENWKDTNPLVSINTLTYNHEKYIAECIEGILKQKTNFAFELLIHDDASTDNTANIIREYEKKYPNIIKPIYQTENQWSKGIKNSITHQYPRAKGKYIAFCEGDDYWIDENKLQMQVDFLENNPEYGMCYTNFNIYYQNRNEFDYDLFTTQSEKYIKEYSSLEQWILRKGYIAPMTWVYKKSLLENYDSMDSCDGTFVMVAHFMANTKIKCLDKTTAVYRVLEESASHSKNLEKMYFRRNNLRIIQHKLIDKYNLDSDLKKLADEEYCKRWIKLFIALNKKEDINLCKNYKVGFKNRFIEFFTKIPFIQKIFSNIYRNTR